MIREVSEVFQARASGGAASTATKSATPEACPGSNSKSDMGPFLAALSDASLALLFAQEIFTAFIWAIANKLTGPIDGGAKVHHTDAVKINEVLLWQVLRSKTLNCQNGPGFIESWVENLGRSLLEYYSTT